MKIFHAKKLVMPFEEKRPAFPSEYNEVAEVSASSLDEAYAMTQNIDSSWVKGAKVKTHLPACRSTSVGDVIKDDSGDFHIVEMIGFSKLPDNDYKPGY